MKCELHYASFFFFFIDFHIRGKSAFQMLLDIITFYDLELLKKPKAIFSPNTCKVRMAMNFKVSYKRVQLLDQS